MHNQTDRERARDIGGREGGDREKEGKIERLALLLLPSNNTHIANYGKNRNTRFPYTRGFYVNESNFINSGKAKSKHLQ